MTKVLWRMPPISSQGIWVAAWKMVDLPDALARHEHQAGRCVHPDLDERQWDEVDDDTRWLQGERERQQGLGWL